MSTTISDFIRRLPHIQLLPNVQVREFIGKDGKPVQSRAQVAYLVRIDQFGQETKQQVRIPLGRDQAPRAPGEYVLGGGGFQSSKYGDIELSRYDIDLIPLPDSIVQLVAKAA